jgi:hypothetical protein
MPLREDVLFATKAPRKNGLKRDVDRRIYNRAKTESLDMANMMSMFEKSI